MATPGARLTERLDRARSLILLPELAPVQIAEQVDAVLNADE